MGCDIHMAVERRIDGAWTFVEPFEVACQWCNGRGTAWGRECCTCLGSGRDVQVFWDQRNYSMFAILAGVRSEGEVPIATPRGLPADADPVTLAETDNHWLGDHSHSWLTVREIMDYDWAQPIYLAGRKVPAATYAVDFLSRLYTYVLPLGDPEDVRLVFGFDN